MQKQIIDAFEAQAIYLKNCIEDKIALVNRKIEAMDPINNRNGAIRCLALSGKANVVITTPSVPAFKAFASMYSIS